MQVSFQSILISVGLVVMDKDSGNEGITIILAVS